MGALPLDIPPGVVKSLSRNAANGRYIDCDKVHFMGGKPEKWPGYRQFSPDTLEGVARGALAWINAFGSNNLSVGTHVKLYALVALDTLEDITPVRATGTINNNPFTTTNGSPVVTVTDTSHLATEGDYVTYSGATAVGGLTIVGEYVIETVINANSYTIRHASNATSGATGGGSSVNAAYQINIGNISATAGLGWSAGGWSEGTWGTPRSSGIAIDLRTWFLQEYGNELLALPFGGSLYLWEQATDARAEQVPNAPASARAMFVTGERFIFLLGTSSPMTVQWPDRDDPTNFTPATNNTANIRTLQSGSYLVAGTRFADNVNLVWSDTSLYLFQYTGSQLVYDSRLVATACGLLAPLAYKVARGSLYWISGHHFHVYNGSVGFIPNAEDIRQFVFRSMNPDQITKTWAEFDEAYNKVRWHYCAGSATEPNRYVEVDIQDFSWAVGTMDDMVRTTGCIVQSNHPELLMVDDEGGLWEHNVGTDANGAPFRASLDWGWYALARGDVDADIFALYPDCERQSGPLSFTIKTYDRPDSASLVDSQTEEVAEGQGLQEYRVSGRHFTMQLVSEVVGGDFRLGNTALDVSGAGARS